MYFFTQHLHKKVNYAKISRMSSKVRNQEVFSYDRYILGVEGSSHVLIFTKNHGCPVYISCHRVLRNLEGTQKPLCTTGDPLVSWWRQHNYKLPPSDVNLCSYVFYDFFATDFYLIQAVPRDKACKGKLCDSHCSSSSCPCLVSECRIHWILEVFSM